MEWHTERKQTELQKWDVIQRENTMNFGTDKSKFNLRLVPEALACRHCLMVRLHPAKDNHFVRIRVTGVEKNSAKKNRRQGNSINRGID